MSREWASIGPSGARRAHGGRLLVGSGPVSGFAFSGERIYLATSGGGLWRSDNNGVEWYPSSDTQRFGAGLPSGAAADLARSSIGVSSLACGAVAVAPNNPDRVYLGTGVFHHQERDQRGIGMLRSDDGGLTWQREEVAAGSPELLGAAVFGLAVDPRDEEHVVAATTRGCYERFLDGATRRWRRVRLHAAGGGGNDGVSEVVTSVKSIVDGANTVFYAAQRGGAVYRSTDPNTAWTQVGDNWATLGVPAAMPVALELGSVNLLYALSGDGKLLRIDLSAAPAHWQRVGGFPVAVTNADFNTAERSWHLSVCVDPTNVNRLFIGGARARLTDGGVTAWVAAITRCELTLAGANWTAAVAPVGFGVPPYVNQLGFAPDGALWVATEGGPFATTTPLALGRLFSAKPQGLSCHDISALAQHPAQESVLFAGTQAAGCLRFTGDEHWTTALRSQAPSGASQFGDAVWPAVHQRDAFQILVATHAGQIRRTTDGGADPDGHQDVSPPLVAADRPLAPYPPLLANTHIAADADANRVVFGAKRLWLSDSFGAAGSWVVISNALPHPITCIAFASKTRLYVGCSGGEVFRFDEAGPPWTSLARHSAGSGLPAGGLQRPVTSIAVDPTDSERFYVTVGGPGIGDIAWFFDGANWQTKHGPLGEPEAQLPRIGANAIVVDPNAPQRLFIGTNGGVWETTDGGAHWHALAPSQPEAAVSALLIHQAARLLRIGTRGRGVFEVALDAETPRVRLAVRDHLLDTGRRDNYGLPTVDPTDGATPVATRRNVTERTSPDIFVDAPDAAGLYQSESCPRSLDLSDTFADERRGLSALEVNTINRIYVRVHNQGSTWAHGVRVVAFVARETAGVVPDLPNDFDRAIRAGNTLDITDWLALGTAVLNDVRAGVPQVARFDLNSDVLFRLAGGSAQQDFRVVVMVHHTDDPFEATERSVDTLARTHRRVATISVSTATPLTTAATIPTLPPSWKPLGPFAIRRGQSSTFATMSGRVSDIAISRDGRRMYVATANGGTWRSDDGGLHWKPLDSDPDADSNPEIAAGSFFGGVFQDRRDTQSVGAVGIDIDNPDKLYIGTGERAAGYFGVGVLSSNDGGANLQAEAAVPALDGHGFYEITVDPSNNEHAFGATTRGLYERRLVAAPNTYNWQVVAAVPAAEFTSVVVAQTGATVRFFAVRRGGNLFTADLTGGVMGAWTAMAPAYPGAGGTTRVSLTVRRTDINNLYVLNQGGALHQATFAAGVWTWTAIAITGIAGNPFPFNQANYNQAFAVSPTNPLVLCIGGSFRNVAGGYAGEVFRLAVAGASAAATLVGHAVHPDVHRLRFREGTDEAWVGCDGGIFFADNIRDAGNNVFESRNTGLGTILLEHVDGHATRDTLLYAGTQDNGGIRYTGEEAWLHVTPGDGGSTVVMPSDPHRALVGYVRHRVNKLDDGGEGPSWGQFLVGANPPPGGSPAGTPDVPLIAGDSTLFYPPIARAPAGDPPRLAFGSQAVWVSDDFGSNWRSIPTAFNAGAASNVADLLPATILSLHFADPNTLYAGLTNGRVYLFTFAAGAWAAPVRLDTNPTQQPLPPTPPGPAFGGANPITSITSPPGSLNTIYVTVGGQLPAVQQHQRVWFFDGAQWIRSSGDPAVVASRLPNSHASAVVVHPTNAARLYAAFDIGVWESLDNGGTWAPYPAAARQLPDAAVVSLLWHNSGQLLLRAGTHGRGMYEIPVDVPNVPAVELYVRDHQLDAARGIASVYGDPDPTRADRRPTVFGASPDIKIDVPDASGQFQWRLDREPSFVEFYDQIQDQSSHVKTHRVPIINRVHVLVHNRGSVVGHKAEVMLLLGNSEQQLPADYANALLSTGRLPGDNWKLIARKRIDDVAASRPRVVTLDLCSQLLPPAGTDNVMVVALVFNRAVDPLRATERAVAVLCNNNRQAASRKIRIENYGSRVPDALAHIPTFAPYMLPIAVALHARAKLEALRAALQSKVNVAPANVDASERAILTLAGTAARTFDVSDRVPATGLGRNLSKYVVLGAAAWDIPDFGLLLELEGGWLGELLRRGGPDGHFSARFVPSSTFIARVAALSLADATSDAERDAVRAFVLGMVSAWASHIACDPLMRGLQWQRSSLDWDQSFPSYDDIEVSKWVAQQWLENAPTSAAWSSWWPEEPPQCLWKGIARAMQEQITDERKGRLFAEAKSRISRFPVPDADELAEGYGLFRRTMSSPMGMGGWFLVLSPLFLIPPFALLLARADVFESRKALAVSGNADERSWYEVWGHSMTFSSVGPLVYSMILWPTVPRRDAYFVQSLVFSIARFALGATFYGTRNESAGLRWGLVFSIASSIDLYFLITTIVQHARGRHGTATQYWLMTLPMLQTGTNLLIALLINALPKSDASFWVTWAIYTAASWLVPSLVLAHHISASGGLVGLLRDSTDARSRLRYLEFLANSPCVQCDTMRETKAYLFDTLTTWASDETGALTSQRYPAGPRALVKIWWEESTELRVLHDRDRVTLRVQGSPDVVVDLDGPLKAQQIVTLLSAALPNLKTKVLDPTLDPLLPAPQLLADPGDSGQTWVVHDQLANEFVKVGGSERKAYVLRHSPRSVLATPIGVHAERCNDDVPLRVLPSDPANIAGSGVDLASDLASLLAMATMPEISATPLQPTGGGTAIGRVHRVFREWNLSERHVEEWQRLFNGGLPAPQDPAAVEPDMRAGSAASSNAAGAATANGLGWIRTLRTWKTLAVDPAVKLDTPHSDSRTSQARIPGQPPRVPTNREVNAALKYLMDLGG